MAQRKAYVGGNWKMNLDRRASVALARAVAEAVGRDASVQVTIFPAFPYLAAVAEVLAEVGTSVRLGAQDFFAQPDGAFTGEVSLSQLRDVGVSVVLVGHSERRHVIGESDVLINEKVRAALEAEMDVVLCVGETLAQREAGQTDAINGAQVSYGLAGVTAGQMGRVTIAYEPVWAIGTGKTATPADAQAAHRAIRGWVRSGLFDGDEAVAQSLRIQYGGSVKPANAAELFKQPDIDGGLIGGASLKADDFLAIIEAAR